MDSGGSENLNFKMKNGKTESYRKAETSLESICTNTSSIMCPILFLLPQHTHTHTHTHRHTDTHAALTHSLSFHKVNLLDELLFSLLFLYRSDAVASVPLGGQNEASSVPPEQYMDQ
jgi:hypothetical protein